MYIKATFKFLFWESLFYKDFQIYLKKKNNTHVLRLSIYLNEDQSSPIFIPETDQKPHKKPPIL